MAKVDTPSPGSASHSDAGFEVEIKTSGRAHDAGVAARTAPAAPTLSPTRAAAKARVRRRNVRLLAIGALVLAAGILYAFVSNPNFSVPSDAVARVNGEYIYNSDIDREINLTKAVYDLNNTKDGKVPSVGDVLEDLINRKLQVQDAHRAGVTVSPDESNSAFKDVLDRMGVTEEALRQVLGKHDLTPDDMRRATNDVYLINKYIGKYVVAGAKDDQDILRLQNEWRTNLAQTSKVDRLKAPGSGPAPTVGAQAPDFTLRDMSGKEVKLSALRGRPIMINFWATWCPPCRAEIPEIVKMYDETHSESSYEILGVATGSEVETIKAFSQEFGMRFPLLPDDGSHVSSLYRVVPIPTTFFIDKEGTIREMHIGPVDRALMQKWLLGE